MTILAYPAGAVRCVSGDHVVQRVGDGRWRVLLVRELVLLTRLVPLGSGKSMSLVEERDMRDSEPPWRADEVHVLAALAPDTFASAEAAIGAIRQSTLGETEADVCLRLSDLPRATCQVHRR